MDLVIAGDNPAAWVKQKRAIGETFIILKLYRLRADQQPDLKFGGKGGKAFDTF